MIIFLYGQDSYRARQKLNEIIEQYEKTNKSGLSLKFFDCQNSNITINNLKDHTRQFSMFKEKKLLVITNIFANSEFKEEFQKIVKELADSEDLILVCEEKDIPKNDSLRKVLERDAKCQEFNLLTGAGLKNWAKKEFDGYKTKIDSRLLDQLIEYVGNDLWRMSNEIKKLVSFSKNKTLKAGDIENLVRSKIETDIFQTIDAIAQKNKKVALKLLQRHLEKGDSPLYLLSMINYQFRNLLIVKDLIERKNTFNALVKKSGLHPFVARKTYFLAPKFRLEELKKIYQKIFQVDLDIKTGKIEPGIALEMLVAEL